ncbi:helix-turn-helix transcriptional regulator [Pseudoalteromonas phenolica]|uniref:helix-turn-helix transcriptional regulator n=1 Tax=Pseudoalteromonas phenolica TaxID=161398 RepID=UPI0038517F15
MQLNQKTIKQLRNDKNWTQQSLADACGLSLRTIQRVEKEGVASRETMMSLCAVFEVKQSSLINLDDVEETNDSQTTVNMKLHLMMLGAAALFGGLVGAGILYLLIS